MTVKTTISVIEKMTENVGPLKRPRSNIHLRTCHSRCYSTAASFRTSVLPS